MSPENGNFDVRVRSAPLKTPQGEDFAPALARAFGVELWMAEHLARNAPIFVKRGVRFDVAERLCATLERLGARVDILHAGSTRSSSMPLPEETLGPSVPSLPARSIPVPSWPPGLPSLSLPPEMVPTRPGAIPSEWRYPTPPPRPSAQSYSSRPPPSGTPSNGVPSPSLSPSSPLLARAPHSSLPSLRPTAPPTTQTWKPLPPPPRASLLGTGSVLLGAAVAIALVFVGVTHWLRRAGDAKLLGNTPNEETTSAGAGHYGLTGPGGLTAPGIEADRQTKLTLIVAWRTGCLGDDYLKFLRDLADAHRGELTVLGAGLAVPESHDPRALGKLPQPPPSPWPPKGCEPGFEVLPIDRGYVSDFLAPPATYLYDSDGSLIAAWRGGMAPVQRERLATWLDGRTWDR